ncbi:hypothetical protein H5410_025294 [Solanum commersonii]|uniref:Uncharacterized protein n=1 Tax=Solanum commersonii TaxID=4109 RepID=A0A9J5YTV4_SOLCO|nr:hypothetical protein H5410_025294 [Solanum commersonii]
MGDFTNFSPDFSGFSREEEENGGRGRFAVVWNCCVIALKLQRKKGLGRVKMGWVKGDKKWVGNGLFVAEKSKWNRGDTDKGVGLLSGF